MLPQENKPADVKSTRVGYLKLGLVTGDGNGFHRRARMGLMGHQYQIQDKFGNVKQNPL